MSSQDNAVEIRRVDLSLSPSKPTPSEVEQTTRDKNSKPELPQPVPRLTSTALDAKPTSPDTSVPTAPLEIVNPELEGNETELPVLTAGDMLSRDGVIISSEIPDSEAESEWSSPMKKISGKEQAKGNEVVEAAVSGEEHAGYVDEKEISCAKSLGLIGHEIGESYGVSDSKCGEEVEAKPEDVRKAPIERKEAKPTEDKHMMAADDLRSHEIISGAKMGKEGPEGDVSPAGKEDETSEEKQPVPKSQEGALATGTTSSIGVDSVPVILSTSAATGEESRTDGAAAKQNIKTTQEAEPLIHTARETDASLPESTETEDVQITLTSMVEDDVALIRTEDAPGVRLGEHTQSLDPLLEAGIMMAEVPAAQNEELRHNENLHSIPGMPNLDEPMLDSPTSSTFQEVEVPSIPNQKSKIGDTELSSTKKDAQETDDRRAPELSQLSNATSTEQKPAGGGSTDITSSPPPRIPIPSDNQNSQGSTQLSKREASKSSLKRLIDNHVSKPQSIPSSPPIPHSKSPAPAKLPDSKSISSFSGPDGSQSKDVLIAELKAMKIASIQARNTSLEAEIASKRAKLEEVTKELSQPAAETVKNHIKLLHDYNDIRDVGQGLVGMIADNRGVRVGELYEEFGVGLKD